MNMDPNESNVADLYKLQKFLILYVRGGGAFFSYSFTAVGLLPSPLSLFRAKIRTKYSFCM